MIDLPRMPYIEHCKYCGSHPDEPHYPDCHRPEITAYGRYLLLAIENLKDADAALAFYITPNSATREKIKQATAELEKALAEYATWGYRK